MHVATDFTLVFSDVSATELQLSGGKGASLARLTAGGLPVPPGFIVTGEAYRQFLAPLTPQITAILQQSADAAVQSRRIQQLIRAQPIDKTLSQSIAKRLQALGAEQWAVAVRSSSTFEDLPGAAFAGQHDTFLNQRGLAEILTALRDCYASLWHEHAMMYRIRLQLAHLDASMAVVVQQMVEMTAADSAGVAFSIDPVQGDLNRVLINACFGLGESVVGGEQEIDEFRVALPDFTVVERNIGQKREIILKDTQGIKHLPLSAEQMGQPSLTDVQCQTVAKWPGRRRRSLVFRRTSSGRFLPETAICCNPGP